MRKRKPRGDRKMFRPDVELSISKENIQDWVREKLEQFHMIHPDEELRLEIPNSIPAKIVEQVKVTVVR